MKNLLLCTCAIFFNFLAFGQEKTDQEKVYNKISSDFDRLKSLFGTEELIHISGMDGNNTLFIQGIEKYNEKRYIFFQTSEKRDGYYSCISIEIQDTHRVFVSEYYAYIDNFGIDPLLVPDFSSGKIRYQIDTPEAISEISGYFNYFREMVDAIRKQKDQQFDMLVRKM